MDANEASRLFRMFIFICGRFFTCAFGAYQHYVILIKITDELDNPFVIPSDIQKKVQKDTNRNNYVRYCATLGSSD